MELEGQIAIVTGASRGIGRACALELGQAGARVVISYRSSAKEAEELAHQLPEARIVQADVANPEDCERIIQTAEDWGDLQVLVNNAGITADGLAIGMTDEQWSSVMEVNAGGTFRLCRSALNSMLPRRSGSIVNLTSISGFRGNAGQVNYSASKAAVIGMTRSLALEVARRSIRVNAVAPGFIETDMTHALPDLVIKEVKKRIPMRRFGHVEDVAPLIRFLAGPSSQYITGQVFVVDGGLSC